MVNIVKYHWDESVATGIAEIDLQHKQFFAVLYDFALDLEQQNGAKKLKKLLVFLKYYGEWHFGREEGCAARYVCPLAETNIEAHKKYMATVEDFIVQCRTTEPTEEMAIAAYKQLTDWLVNHIMKIDKHIGEYIKAAS